MIEQELRILHLEDLPSDAALANREIGKVLKNYSIRVVETEADFISELEGFNPHIVVSDYQLPSFNGLSALKIVLDKSPLTPVIILTGSMNEDTAVDCMKAGASDYVIKEHIKRLGTSILNALEQKKNKAEKIRSEETLLKSEEKFRSLFENHAATKLLIDAETGNIVDANNAAVIYYGWSIDELKKMNINNINILPVEEVKTSLLKGKDLNRVHFDFIHRLKDGSLRNVEVFSSKVEIEGKDFLHSIIHDVTEKKKAEQQIILLSKSIEQSPVSIVITDPNGNVEYVNQKFSELTGYNVHEVIGQNPRILKSGNQSKEFYQKMWGTIIAGNDWKGEMHNKKKNGELYWESVAISSIENEEGEILHFIGVKEDVTEKKQILKELVIAKEHAEESDHLKTAFLHNISHEIRTPMNAIVGFSGFLNDPDLDPEKRQHFIDIIVQSSDQLLSIISDIVCIASIEAGQERMIEKEMEIQVALLLLHEQFLLKANTQNVCLTLKSFLPEREVWIKTDETKLIEVLTNLISNALKFTQQGYVNFGCKIEETEDVPSLQFFVEDTGLGIPLEMQDEIFKRFRQVETSAARLYGGSGLGLSISKAYVEILGGKIWVKSELGKGSTFYFTIPYVRVQKNTFSEKQFNNNLKIEINEHKTILVAEDDDANFMLMEELLSGLNTHIIRAINGLEAVGICKTNTHIDLVLMDIKMPIMDGYEATKQIKGFMPNLPIIAQTAYFTDIDKSKALACGCIDFISKPIKRELLFSKIEMQLAKVVH
jgi:PAS domain S-box-containing protein